MRRKKGTDDAPATGARITPEEVQQVEFRLAFRGYNERDVDAFLDRITEGLSWYLEELERLRLVGGQPLQAVAGPTGDAGAVEARARAEADEIVRRAHEQAAGIRAGAGSGDARGAVAPFLNREREFLQGLGGLVQAHAEEIKQMVLTIRERAEASSVPDAARSDATPSSVPEVRASVETDATGERGTPASSASQMPAAAPPADLEPASAAEIRERLQASEPPVEIGPADEDDLPPKAAAPIVVESGTEPVFSTEGAPATERRERSLRELFWGED
jgi:DivIVA domain-containing protein